MSEAEEEKQEIVRDESGRFVPGHSGLPTGRPKGTKNKITLMKLMAEQAVREGSLDQMKEVCKLIIEEAMAGDKQSQKLVWDSIVTKAGNMDSSSTTEKVEITINGPSTSEIKPVNIIDHESEDTTDE